MDISAFLSSTRCVRNDPKQVEVHYRALFAHLSSQFGASGLVLPELEVISSWQRSCEIVELGGRSYLVYDQYMGQTLNTLNRIYHNSTDRQDAEVYGLKVVGEYLFLKGRPDLSAMLLAAHGELRKEHQSYRHDVDRVARLGFTTVQECFVMVHELLHLFMAQRPNPRFLRTAREFFVEAVERLNDPDPHAGAAAHLQDSYTILAPRGAPPPPAIGTVEFEKFLDTSQRYHQEFSRQWIDLLESRDDIVEECICDTQAAEITFAAMREWGFPRQVIADALFAGLLHLRITAVLERYADKLIGAGDSPPLGSFFQESVARVSAFRHHFAAVLSVPGRKRIGAALHQRFVNVSIRHSSIVLDPVLFGLDERLSRLRKDPAALPDPPSTAEAIQMRKDLEELMLSASAEPHRPLHALHAQDERWEL